MPNNAAPNRDPDDDGDLRDLFARTAPAPTPTDLAPLRAAPRPEPVPPVPPTIRTRRPPMKLAAASLAALGLAFAAAALWRTDRSVAFADVRAAIAAAESIEYMTTERTVYSPPRSRGDEPVDTLIRIRTLFDGGRVRYEASAVACRRGDEPRETCAPIVSSLHYVKVTDFDRGYRLSIDYTVPGRSVVVKSLDDADAESRREFYAERLAWLRNLPDAGVEPLEPRRIGGVDAPGFVVPEFPISAEKRGPAEVWVDPADGLPLRVEAFKSWSPTFRDQEGHVAEGQRLVMTDFDFAPAVPPDAFELNVPPGYHIRTPDAP